MCKKLNIIEAMKMPPYTEFEVEFDGEKILNNTMIIYRSLTGDKECKHMDWKCHPQDTFMKPYDYLINGVFIPIQQPVSFMEAIVAYHKGKIINNKHEIDGKVFNHKYVPDGIFYCIKDTDNCAMIADEILNAKWYIEESEELEDERLS